MCRDRETRQVLCASKVLAKTFFSVICFFKFKTTLLNFHYSLILCKISSIPLKQCCVIARTITTRSKTSLIVEYSRYLNNFFGDKKSRICVVLLRLKVLMFIDCICSTLQMLTNIENRLEELFEQIEVMPPDRVEMAEKVRWEKLQNSVSNIKLLSNRNITQWNVMKSCMGRILPHALF